MVEGKYGQEYRINLKDVQPLMKNVRKKPTGNIPPPSPGKTPYTIDEKKLSRSGLAPEAIYDHPEYQFLLRRNNEILMELGRCRGHMESLERSTLELKQEIEEKDMLIAMLTKKSSGA